MTHAGNRAKLHLALKQVAGSGAKRRNYQLQQARQETHLHIVIGHALGYAELALDEVISLTT